MTKHYHLTKEQYDSMSHFLDRNSYNYLLNHGHYEGVDPLHIASRLH